MADYMFAEIGFDWKIAFRISDVVKVYHSMDPMFSQVSHEAVSLPSLFGAAEKDGSTVVAIILKDGSGWLAENSFLEKKNSEPKIFPLLPALFMKGKEWARAVLVTGGTVSFVSDAEGLGRLKDG